jgi:hypothetical protein
MAFDLKTRTAKCSGCNQSFYLAVTDEQIRNWRGGTLIQNAMPNLSDDERELLISGTCGTCFDRMFMPTAEDMRADFEEGPAS